MSVQILGVRTGSKFIQYAVLEFDDENCKFINKSSEHKLILPTNLANIEDKIKWVYDEFEGIYTKYPQISRVNLKVNEYVNDTKANRLSSYFDAIIMLTAKKHNKETSQYIYANFKCSIKANNVKEFAESNIGKSDKYWDKKMADALVAAWFGRPNGN